MYSYVYIERLDNQETYRSYRFTDSGITFKKTSEIQVRL